MAVVEEPPSNAAKNDQLAQAKPRCQNNLKRKRKLLRVNWWAWFKYVLWCLLTKVVLGIIYVSTIREGLSYLIPALGQRVSKIPGLFFFADFESLYRLDLAFFMAIFILIAVFWMWDKIILLKAYGDTSEFGSGEFGFRREQLYLGLGGTLIVADALLFYLSMCQAGWGGTTFSLSALLATIAYLAVLIFVSVSTIELRQKIKEYDE